MKIQDIDMKTIDIAIQSLKGEREDNDQFNAGMYYIRDLIEPFYNNLVKENKVLKEQKKKAIEYINEVKDKYYHDWGEDDGSYDTYLSELEIEKVLKLLGGDE